MHSQSRSIYLRASYAPRLNPPRLRADTYGICEPWDAVLATLSDRERSCSLGGGSGTWCATPTGVGRFMSAMLAGGGMVASLDPDIGVDTDAEAEAGAGAPGRGWAVAGVADRSITVAPTSSWPADCDRSMSIVSDRCCCGGFGGRTWLGIVMEIRLCGFTQGGGEVARIASMLLT